MQHVQNDVTALRILPDLVHGSGVNRAPAIDERGPVGLDAAFLAPRRKIRDQAGAPVDHRSEHVEDERFDLRKVGHGGLLLIPCHSGAPARASPESIALQERWEKWIPDSR